MSLMAATGCWGCRLLAPTSMPIKAAGTMQWGGMRNEEIKRESLFDDQILLKIAWLKNNNSNSYIVLKLCQASF